MTEWSNVSFWWVPFDINLILHRRFNLSLMLYAKNCLWLIAWAFRWSVSTQYQHSYRSWVSHSFFFHAGMGKKRKVDLLVKKMKMQGAPDFSSTKHLYVEICLKPLSPFLSVMWFVTIYLNISAMLRSYPYRDQSYLNSFNYQPSNIIHT